MNQFTSILEDISIPVFKTDLTSIKDLFGVDGIPKNKIIDISGDENSGKTAFVLHTIANLQKRDHFVAYIDADRKLNIDYIIKEGIDTEALFVINNNIGEEIEEFIINALKSKTFSLIVIDSIASIISNKEYDSSMEKEVKQSIINQVIKTAAEHINNSNCTIIFTTQFRSGKNNSEFIIGKKAFDLYSSISIEAKKESDIFSKEIKIGEKILLKTLKNKINSPFKKSYYDIIY